MKVVSLFGKLIESMKGVIEPPIDSQSVRSIVNNLNLQLVPEVVKGAVL